MSKIRINSYVEENPKVKENMRIASISDIHSEVKTLDEIYELLKQKKVDMICMPGDIIDQIHDSRNKDLLLVLKKISQLAKTYISLGNHDICDRGVKYLENEEPNLDYFKELESKTECTVLKEEFESIRHNDNVTVNAFNYPLKYYIHDEDERVSYSIISSFTGHLDSNSFNILLSHSPNRLLYEGKILTIMAIINEMNLILCGHNHGCLTPTFIQDKSKKKTGLVGPYRQLLLKNGYGSYYDNKASLIINNGVTKIAKSSSLGNIRKPINKIFIPDVDIINVTNGNKNKLELKNRKLVRM